MDRFAKLYALSPIGVALADRDGVIFESNRALVEMLGHARNLPDGTRLGELGAGQREQQVLLDALTEAAELERPLYRERIRLTHEHEGARWCRITMLSLRGDTPGAHFPALLVEDVNELHMLQEMLRKQTVEDRLTGLGNNAGFVGQLDTLPSLPSGERAALVYLDIDGFKMINDGLGAEVADTVLAAVAGKLRAAFTSFDAYIARVAGDGFAVLMHGDLTSSAVTTMVDELIGELNEPLYVDDIGIGVSVSAGITVHDTPISDPAELLRAAEITVHRAKRRGKAQWMLFDQERDTADRDRYALGAAIGGGLEQGEFELEYQPTVTLDGTGRVMVINGSLRWNHPQRGVLTDDEFYPLADTTGMTLPLGRRLLEDSIAAASGWYERLGDSAPDLCLRLPKRLTTDPNLVGMVRDELARNTLPAAKVRLCADSAALLDSHGEAPESLALLAELDVQIALAVAGASDLELIESQKLPVGFLMLSESLVATADDTTDPAHGSSIHLDALIKRAHQLGLRRIGAEGVHTSARAESLRELGVVAGRGSLFGAATDSVDLDELLNGSGKYT